jgi:hypothetical protein
MMSILLTIGIIAGTLLVILTEFWSTHSGV